MASGNIEDVDLRIKLRTNIYGETYIQGVNWVTCLGGVYIRVPGGLYTWSVLTGFYAILKAGLCS